MNILLATWVDPCRVVREPFGGTLTLDGYGVAAVSDAATETEID